MSEEKQYIITESQMKVLTTTMKDIYKSKTKRKRKTTNDDDDAPWTCAGHVWEDPPTPCVPSDKSNVKMGIKHNNKRVIVCKGCKLARDRHKNKLKKKKKLEEKKDE